MSARNINPRITENASEISHSPEDISNRQDAPMAHKIEEKHLNSSSDLKFRQFAELLPETVFEIDLQGNFLFLNNKSYQAFGYSKEDRNLNAFSMFIPSDIPRIQRNIASMLSGVSPDDHHYTALRKDGSTFPVLLYSDQVLENGKHTGFRGFIIDISDRLQAEKALKQSDEKYRTLADQLPVGVYRTTRDGRFVYYNAGLARMLGFESDGELDNLQVNDLFYDKGLRNNLFNGLSQESGPVISELMLVRKDGQIIWVRDQFRPSFDRDGNPEYFDGILEDITQKKMLEARLQQSEKLEAIGSLAGGIAHDFNNLLMGMHLYTELALKEAGNNERLRSKLEQVLAAQRRGKQLVQQILNFSKQEGTPNEMVQLNRLLEETIQIIEPSFPAGIQLTKKMDVRISIPMNPLHLHQITMNLLTNAVHALEGQGKIGVDLDLIPGSKLHHIRPGLQPDTDYVQLVFSDNGPGIDEGIQKLIFNPFFTTKKAGMGTGLGLSIVQSILSQYHGAIFLESQKGQGTRFYIYLPHRVMGKPEAFGAI